MRSASIRILWRSAAPWLGCCHISGPMAAGANPAKAIGRRCATGDVQRRVANGLGYLGLMAAGEIENPATARGIAYLIESQDRDGKWNGLVHRRQVPARLYLGVGYLAFPLWALALSPLSRGSLRRTAFGL
jgi:squalene-hopene/tetraprenyl-beta-curcumene cyclase